MWRGSCIVSSNTGTAKADKIIMAPDYADG